VSSNLGTSKFDIGHSGDNKKRPIKLVIYRPHANVWFKPMVLHILKRKRWPNKYSPFFDYIINSQMETYLCTDLFYDKTLPGYLKSIRDALELLAWCLFNKISVTKTKLLFSKRQVNSKDVLFSMYYGNFTHENEIVAHKCEKLAAYLSDLSVVKIIHMTHYVYHPLIGCRNLSWLKPDVLVAENNLSINSEFFNKYFEKISADFMLLPPVPAPRFAQITQFSARINKIVATGSITFKMKDEEFLKFFGIDELQPLRRQLFENADKYLGEMDCMISDLNATIDPKYTDIPIGILKRIFKSIFGHVPQQDYFSKDIVRIYNNYKMFVVPEEICDLPAIGFVEGMACGSAYFGQEHPMYRDIGLIAGYHYIPYDGTMADLMSKVHYYQNNTDALETIAKNGLEFVSNKLNMNVVYNQFFAKIYKYAEIKFQ